MCKKWRDSFVAFFKDMGLRPTNKHSLDRFPDMDGNYEPHNCRWATKQEQARNRRNSKYLEYKGVRYFRLDFVKLLGVSVETFLYQLERHRTIENVVEYYRNRKSINI